MPFFRKASQKEANTSPAGEEQNESFSLSDANESLSSLEGGGMGKVASRRLSMLTLDTNSSFTSDLSVDEFVSTKAHGVEPITQVSGSCVYNIGYWQIPNYAMGSVDFLQSAYNEARNRAFRRLELEAKEVDADVVAGIRLLDTELELPTDSIAYSVVGTAMRSSQLRKIAEVNAISRPIVTTLSGQDLSKLLRHGYVPLGVVADTKVMFAALSMGTLSAMRYIYAGGGNFEIPEFTQCYYESMSAVKRAVAAQGNQMGAVGLVGSNLKVRARGLSISQMSGENPDAAIYTADMICTAISSTNGHDSDKTTGTNVGTVVVMKP